MHWLLLALALGKSKSQRGLETDRKSQGSLLKARLKQGIFILWASLEQLRSDYDGLLQNKRLDQDYVIYQLRSCHICSLAEDYTSLNCCSCTHSNTAHQFSSISDIQTCCKLAVSQTPPVIHRMLSASNV